MTTLRPHELARRQLEIDRELTRSLPELHARKHARLILSPHAFLRGSAPLFYELLAAHPELAGGPPGEGWIVGDMHLENMGAYKSDGASLVFDLNDFDDAGHGPLRWDVVRLSTSLVLSGRALGLRGIDCVANAERLLERYVEAASGARVSEPPPMAAPMVAIAEAAMRRTKRALLDARAPFEGGRRRFVRGDRYHELDRGKRELALSLVPRFVAALGSRAPARAQSWRVGDVALRIAGTGSLGRLRFAVLVSDSEGEERILDLKEAGPSSIERASPSSPLPSDPRRFAARVVDGANALVPSPPKMLAAVEAAEVPLSFIGRQLCPQEDKLEVAKLPDRAMLASVAERAGFMLGAAHARSGAGRWVGGWTAGEVSGLIDRAIELAGLYEAIYLAYGRSSRPGT